MRFEVGVYFARSVRLCCYHSRVASETQYELYTTCPVLGWPVLEDSVTPWFSDHSDSVTALIQWSPDSVITWFSDHPIQLSPEIRWTTLIQWSPDSVITWFTDHMIQWSPGSVITSFSDHLIQWLPRFSTGHCVGGLIDPCNTSGPLLQSQHDCMNNHRGTQ